MRTAPPDAAGDRLLGLVGAGGADRVVPGPAAAVAGRPREGGGGGPGAGRRGRLRSRRQRLGNGPPPEVPSPGARHRPGPPDAQDAAGPAPRGLL
ncbi:MAG: hypothetical protein B7Z62_02105 [Deltaproteobacteria bacterium 37-65-8]|nr:MAG: hypothetical protein B7Z62_02105 [Deltaproteobacteria bacterium 37-65-8]